MIPLTVGAPSNSIVGDNGVRQIPVELEPGVISFMDESLLFKRWGIDEDDRAQTQWIEYWLKVPTPDRPELKPVHRSAHVFVKQSLSLEATQGLLNG